MDRMRDITIPRNVFLVLAGITGLWLLWDSLAYRLVTYALYADYWEHSAALTEWLRSLTDPGNPHVATAESSARYIPPYFVLAAAGGPLGLDAIDLMAASAIINYVLVTLGIYLFGTIYFRNPWAPGVLFVLLLAGWGVPWIWANLYELRSLFMTASYPATFVFGLALISFWLTLAFMRGLVGFFGGLGGLLLLSALMFVSHPLTGVFAIGGGCLLALTERDAAVSLRVLVILMLPAGALLAAAWPFFSVWDVILASSDELDDRTWQAFGGIDAMLERARSGAWYHMFFDPRQFLVALGPALLGLPLALWLLLRWRFLFIPLGALLMAGPLVLNVFFQVALAHRFLLYVVFFLHLALTWGILELFDRWSDQRRTKRPTGGVLIGVSIVRVMVVLLAVFHVGLLAGDYRGAHLNNGLRLVDKRAALPFGYDVPRLYTELTAALPDDAVVIGDRWLTWPLPTFRGKTVALPPDHENSLVADQFERVDAVEAFLAAGTTAEERRGIAQRYGATHVLVNPRDSEAELLGWLRENAEPVSTAGWYQMFELR